MLWYLLCGLTTSQQVLPAAVRYPVTPIANPHDAESLSVLNEVAALLAAMKKAQVRTTQISPLRNQLDLFSIAKQLSSLLSFCGLASLRAKHW